MASGDEGSNKTVVTGGEESRKSRRGRSRSRDVMVDINGRLAKVELAIASGQDKFEEVERRLDELEGEEFRGEVLATVNRVAADSEDRDKALEATFQSEISSLRQELERVLAELAATKGSARRDKGRVGPLQ